MRNKKRILLTRAAIAPYDVYLFNRLSEHFDINVLYFEPVEPYRKWEWVKENARYKHFFAITKQMKLFGKTLNISRLPDNLDLDEFDEIILETDTKNLLNNIILLKQAQKHNKTIGVNITIYKGYKIFYKGNIISSFLNFIINQFIKKYFFKNTEIKKYIGYGHEHCSLVENNKPCFSPGYYYSLKEEYGVVSLDDVKSFNIKRFDKGKIKLLIISYLTPRKNVDFVIRLINKFKDKFELHIVGDGDPKYVSYLKSLSTENVFFHGIKFGKEKENFLKNSDFLIFHSLKDVWGLVLHEAMYFGLPFIASKNVPSARQILNDCKCGFIYNNENEFLKILNYISKEMNKEKYIEISLKSKIFMDRFNEECYENWKKFLEI